MTRSSHVRHICAGTGCPRQPLSPVADSLSAATDRLSIAHVRERGRPFADVEGRSRLLRVRLVRRRYMLLHTLGRWRWCARCAVGIPYRCGILCHVWIPPPWEGFCAAKGFWDARCADMMCAEAMHNQPVHVFNLEAPLPVFGPTQPRLNGILPLLIRATRSRLGPLPRRPSPT